MKINAFVIIPNYVNNTPGVVASIGELSPNSKTFSRELGSYTHSTYRNVQLVTFDSENNDVAISLPVNVRDKLFYLANWILDTSARGDYTDDSDNFGKLFKLNNQNYIVDEVGTMVQSDSAKWFPSFIYFRDADNEYSLWFSDSEFDKEYPEYDLFPILPLENMDDLHLTRAEAIGKIKSVTVTNIFNTIDVIRQSLPYTHQYPLEIEWVDKDDPSVTEPITFVVLIYGNKGKNLDYIKNKLVEAILKDSDYSRTQWEKILPQLFLPNEFFIAPMWQDIAVPGLTVTQNVYSPSSDLHQMMDYAVSCFDGVTDNHVIKNAEHLTTLYKSIGAFTVGNVKNQSGIYRFKDLFPEYTSVTTMDSAFGRMDKRTREFIMVLKDALHYAERLNGKNYVNLPNHFSTVVRNGKNYLTFTYDKIVFLVSTIGTTIHKWNGDLTSGGTIESPEQPWLQTTYGSPNSGYRAIWASINIFDVVLDQPVKTSADWTYEWNAFIVKNGTVIANQNSLVVVNEPGGTIQLFSNLPDGIELSESMVVITCEINKDPEMGSDFTICESFAYDGGY